MWVKILMLFCATKLYGANITIRMDRDGRLLGHGLFGQNVAINTFCSIHLENTLFVVYLKDI